MATGTDKKTSKAKGAAKKAAPTGKSAPAGTPRLLKRYREDVVPALMKEFAYANIMQVPKLTKIVINFGLGEAVADPSIIQTTFDELTAIAGQKPVVTRAKKAIANFKLRAGLAIGVKVTLRGERMWEFLDRLITVAMPRIRDFKGISGKAFSGRGDYNWGGLDHTVFPEIDYDKVKKVRGFNVSFVTSASDDVAGKSMFKLLGMPFRN